MVNRSSDRWFRRNSNGDAHPVNSEGGSLERIDRHAILWHADQGFGWLILDGLETGASRARGFGVDPAGNDGTRSRFDVETGFPRIDYYQQVHAGT